MIRRKFLPFPYRGPLRLILRASAESAHSAPQPLWENAINVPRQSSSGPIARGLFPVAIGIAMAIGDVNSMAWLSP